MLMKHVIVKAVLFCLILIFTAQPCFAQKFKVLNVVDGDTIEINFKGKKEKVTLLHVKTPESAHPKRSKNTKKGKKAAAYTKKRLLGKSVNLEFVNKKRGKRGQLLAYIFVNGKNFNVELVKKGWGTYDTKHGKSIKYHAQFTTAKTQANKGNNEVSKDKNRSDQKPASKSSTTSVASGTFHGNIDTKIFHKPGCTRYNCKKCTGTFNSMFKAVKAGYTPCKTCKPR
ncbi:MAG: hypothetical protein GY729_13965 [Desulfobacteraceae bacterium]|nr:hypothetical protein [Desulfobacteraceae bacterium]